MVTEQDQQYVYMDDLRVLGQDPLIPPQILSSELPLSTSSRRTIAKARLEAQNIIQRIDRRRLIVIAGPCSIHDVGAAKEYGFTQSLTKPTY